MAARKAEIRSVDRAAGIGKEFQDWDQSLQILVVAVIKRIASRQTTDFG